MRGGGYDPGLRRDTPLALKLKARIAAGGPISIADYMEACLTDPEYGYYRTRAAIGRGGDFITAPEISQTFGELIGLWAVVVWQQMGSPERFILAELGPGRGTLMGDALRAARAVPGFRDAVEVILVEVAATDFSFLVELLPEGRLRVAEAIGEVPVNVPAIVIGNEFLDTCPVQQFIVEGGKIRVRAVGLEDSRLHWTSAPAIDWVSLQSAFAATTALGEGDIFEAQDWTVLHRFLHGRTAPWAALFADYGHFDPERPETKVTAGDTLQAIRNHLYEHPLTSPGEADLTCHVNFNDVKRQFCREAAPGAARLAVDGPVTQAEFLGRLGVIERASRLMAANPAQAGEIEAGVVRLIAPQGMGTRFKVIGVRSSDVPPLPGFI